ncbi:hypothetical protein J2Z80_000111 [Thermoanaerobacterium butyriciformans]|uniref:Uncharacterized protein n=1 Tax=Thermoanaerobacterium butyriciformans TaxID=1702242 RepID=A0ABS4NC78_9THEO|nr:hypothetical protein [Thermoanaerobacterium butyriciformans]
MTRIFFNLTIELIDDDLIAELANIIVFVLSLLKFVNSSAFSVHNMGDI